MFFRENNDYSEKMTRKDMFLVEMKGSAAANNDYSEKIARKDMVFDSGG